MSRENICARLEQYWRIANLNALEIGRAKGAVLRFNPFVVMGNKISSASINFLQETLSISKVLTFDFVGGCRSSLSRLTQIVTILLVGCLMENAQVLNQHSVDLHGVDLHGKQISLTSAGEHQITVLIFVRTDCPITNRYAPTLQKLAADYAGKAEFWLIYPDNSESTAQIERYLREYQYKGFAIARDPQHSLVKLSRAQIMPEAAVFDSSSRLLYHGRIDNWFQSFAHPRPQPTTHELDDAIRAALEGKSVAVPETKAVGCYISDVE